MSHSKLLVDDYPLVVIPELAKQIGLDEAIVLQQVHYWVVINERKNANLQDGFHWTYNTYAEWKEQFPFWSMMTIRRIISKLERSGYLISGNYNRKKYDRTKWYRVDYSRLRVNSPCVQIEQSPDVQTEQLHEVDLNKPIPETKAETTAKTTSLSKNPYIGQLQVALGFPRFINEDPIPNHAREAKFIKKMLDRGFEWDDIFKCWKDKQNRDQDKYIQMAWVNEDIAKFVANKRGKNGTYRRDTKEATAGLKASVGKPLS